MVKFALESAVAAAATAPPVWAVWGFIYAADLEIYTPTSVVGTWVVAFGFVLRHEYCFTTASGDTQ